MVDLNNDPSKDIDVLGMGNAIVDILSQVDDELIVNLELNKGAMTLVSADQARMIFAAMGQTVQQSGGSAANTIAGLASFGAQTSFIGKVADDHLGEVFAHDMRGLGVAFTPPASHRDEPTASCHILVTKDGERTMCTHLGISTEIEKDDIDPKELERARIVYSEGYLFDKPKAKEAFYHLAALANETGALSAFSLSDPFCVERHRVDLQEWVRDHVDILFANEQEVIGLTETDNREAAFEKIADYCPHAVVTLGSEGAVVVDNDQRIDISPQQVFHLVDTTGAGDLFAAGYLYGLTQGFDVKKCGELGCKAAAQIITHMGPRPETPLSDLL